MNNTWDADSYRDNFSFVPKYGEDVLKLLTVGLGSKVVDLGCGNGSLTDRLQSLGYQVMGIDASPAMLEIARKEYPNISFQQADALSFQLDKPADAIFSNAVFHWIDADKQETLLRNVSRNLRPGGELVCEFGGHGCGEAVHSTLEELFREHKRTYKKIVFFPTIGQYAPLIEKCGMRVEYAILFDRPTPQKGTIKDWIRMFDLKPFDGIPEEETEAIINEAEERLRSRLFIDGTWYVDYVRIRLRARKL